MPWFVALAGAVFAVVLAVGLFPSLRAAAQTGATIQQLRAELRALEQVARRYPSLRVDVESASGRLEETERDLPDPAGFLQYPGNWEQLAERSDVDLLRVMETSGPSKVTYREGQKDYDLPYLSVEMVLVVSGPRDRLVEFAAHLGKSPALVIQQLTLQAAGQPGTLPPGTPPASAPLPPGGPALDSTWTLTVRATAYMREPDRAPDGEAGAIGAGAPGVGTTAE